MSKNPVSGNSKRQLRQSICRDDTASEPQPGQNRGKNRWIRSPNRLYSKICRFSKNTEFCLNEKPQNKDSNFGIPVLAAVGVIIDMGK